MKFRYLKNLKYLAGVLFALVLLLSIVTPVLAVANPDSIYINSVRVFENLWETDDQLYFVEYEVNYASEPTEEPGDTFLIGIFDGSTVLVTAPIVDYQHNISVIYLDADEALVWGSDYSIKVFGNPTYFASLVEGTNLRTLLMTADYWVTGAQEESRGYLGDWCLGVAEDLEIDWAIDLLTSSGKLNDTGSEKFLEAIPGLNNICPEIFSTVTFSPEVTTTSFAQTYAKTLTPGTKLQGIVDDLGDTIGVPGVLIGGAGLMMLYFILAGRIFIATGNTATAIVLGIPFILAGVLLGLLPLVWVFVAGFTVIVLFAIIFILGRFA